MNETASILPRRTLQVTGTASVTVKPDVSYMSFVIETEHKNVAKAYRENKKASDQVFTKLKALGVEERDLKTTYFYIMPFYKMVDNSARQVIDAYRILHYTLVTARDLARISDILDAAVDAGATGLSSISFTVENPKKYTEEARREAIRAAMKKAQETADIMGFKLGTPVSVTESEPGYRQAAPYPQASMAMERAAPQAQGPQLEPGEMNLARTVYVTYEIEPK